MLGRRRFSILLLIGTSVLAASMLAFNVMAGPDGLAVLGQPGCGGTSLQSVPASLLADYSNLNRAMKLFFDPERPKGNFAGYFYKRPWRVKDFGIEITVYPDKMPGGSGFSITVSMTREVFRSKYRGISLWKLAGPFAKAMGYEPQYTPFSEDWILKGMVLRESSFDSDTVQFFATYPIDPTNKSKSVRRALMRFIKTPIQLARSQVHLSADNDPYLVPSELTPILSSAVVRGFAFTTARVEEYFKQGFIPGDKKWQNPDLIKNPGPWVITQAKNEIIVTVTPKGGEWDAELVLEFSIDRALFLNQLKGVSLWELLKLHGENYRQDSALNVNSQQWLLAGAMKLDPNYVVTNDGRAVKFSASMKFDPVIFPKKTAEEKMAFARAVKSMITGALDIVNMDVDIEGEGD